MDRLGKLRMKEKEKEPDWVGALFVFSINVLCL